MTSRRPPPIPAGADAPILTGRLLLQPVVEGDAEVLAELFLDERMYRFTDGQPARWTTFGPPLPASRPIASTTGTGRRSATGRCGAAPTARR